MTRGIVKRERGSVLIMLLYVLLMMLSVFIMEKYNVFQMQKARTQKTQQALVEAKAALLGRAILDDNRPGSLPCPDAEKPIDGSADLFRGNRCPSYIGRFPWRTLGIPELQDADGEALWYTLSANYRDHSAVMPINSSSSGLLSVDTENDVVAIIFAVGAPLNTQTGRPSRLVQDYLEGENANGDDSFSSVRSPAQNDQLLAITRVELMRQVERRVLGEVARQLHDYYADPSHGHFPYAAATSDTCNAAPLISGFMPKPHDIDCPAPTLPKIESWFYENAWSSLLRYEVAAACTQTFPNCSGNEFINDGQRDHIRVRLTITGSGQQRLID